MTPMSSYLNPGLASMTGFGMPMSASPMAGPLASPAFAPMGDATTLYGAMPGSQCDPYGGGGYGQAASQRPKPALSDEEKKALQAQARAIGGSNDLDGDGKVGCSEKEAAQHIRDDFKKKMENDQALAVGAQALGFKPSDLR